jgi:hypothetical protein
MSRIGHARWKARVKKLLFIITEKTRAIERKCYGVGVIKDKELNLEDVKDTHTLG